MNELLQNDDDLELCFLGILVNRSQERLQKDVIFTRGLVEYLHVFKVGMASQYKMTWECPRGSRPSQKGGLGILYERETNYNRRVQSILVVLRCFEVAERCVEGRGKWHDLVASIYGILVPQFLEYPPNRLHELDVHSLCK